MVKIGRLTELEQNWLKTSNKDKLKRIINFN